MDNCGFMLMIRYIYGEHFNKYLYGGLIKSYMHALLQLFFAKILLSWSNYLFLLNSETIKKFKKFKPILFFQSGIPCMNPQVTFLKKCNLKNLFLERKQNILLRFRIKGTEVNRVFLLHSIFSYQRFIFCNFLIFMFYCMGDVTPCLKRKTLHYKQ